MDKQTKQAKQKEYNDKNKFKVKCNNCGSIVSKRGFFQHKKSLKCIEYGIEYTYITINKNIKVKLSDEAKEEREYKKKKEFYSKRYYEEKKEYWNRLSDEGKEELNKKLEWENEKLDCLTCNYKIMRKNINRHNKSKKHLNFLEIEKK